MNPKSINVIGNDADEIWSHACDYVHHLGDVVVSRDLKDGKHVTTRTKELLHFKFTLTNPRQRVIFSRPLNPAFAIAEVLWILSGSSHADFLLYWNPRMKRWMNKDKTFHGAYGNRLGSRTLQNIPGKYISAAEYMAGVLPSAMLYNSFFDQLYGAYEILKETPHSRQVVLQIWDKLLDFPNTDSPASVDVPCNIISDLKVRDGKLHWLQFMRSNDLIWGVPYNFIQWTSIQEIVAGWLGLDLGTYTHISSSLHVYEKHWDHLEDILDDYSKNDFVNEDSLMIKGYENWLEVFYQVLNTVYLIMMADISVLGCREIVDSIEYLVKDMPRSYANICWLLLAEHFRKSDYLQDSKDISNRISNYWRKSWLNWFYHNHR